MGGHGYNWLVECLCLAISEAAPTEISGIIVRQLADVRRLKQMPYGDYVVCSARQDVNERLSLPSVYSAEQGLAAIVEFAVGDEPFCVQLLSEKGRIVHLGVSRDVPGSRPEGDVRLKSFVELPKPCVDMQELEGFRRAGLDMFGHDEWFLHPYEGKWLLVVGNVGEENYLMVHCYDRRGGYSVFNYIDDEMVLGRCGFDEALRRCGGMADRQNDSDQSGVSENTEASRRKLLRNKIDLILVLSLPLIIIVIKLITWLLKQNVFELN